MTKTDTKHRKLTEKTLDFLSNSHIIFGITGALCDDYTVSAKRENIFSFEVIRNNGYLITLMRFAAREYSDSFFSSK